MSNTRYSCQILMKLKFSSHSFKKYPNIKFHENPSSGSRIVTCGLTDRQTRQTRFAVLRTRVIKTHHKLPSYNAYDNPLYPVALALDFEVLK